MHKNNSNKYSGIQYDWKFMSLLVILYSFVRSYPEIFLGGDLKHVFYNCIELMF